VGGIQPPGGEHEEPITLDGVTVTIPADDEDSRHVLGVRH